MQLVTIILTALGGGTATILALRLYGMRKELERKRAALNETKAKLETVADNVERVRSAKEAVTRHRDNEIRKLEKELRETINACEDPEARRKAAGSRLRNVLLGAVFVAACGGSERQVVVLHEGALQEPPPDAEPIDIDLPEDGCPEPWAVCLSPDAALDMAERVRALERYARDAWEICGEHKTEE